MKSLFKSLVICLFISLTPAAALAGRASTMYGYEIECDCNVPSPPTCYYDHVWIPCNEPPNGSMAASSNGQGNADSKPEEPDDYGTMLLMTSPFVALLLRRMFGG